MGPPEQVIEIATFSHVCEDQIIAVIKENGDVPLLARRIYTQNKNLIG